jgi:hypothetical protein
MIAHYWRIDAAQRWRQAPDLETAQRDAETWLRRQIGSEGFAPSPAGRPILRESIEGEFRARVASIEIIDETEYARRGGVVACTVEVVR